MKNANIAQKNTPIAKPYRGRFAPTPSGELHFGSLLAAMASYADARAHQGQWLLRIDDIDQARVVAESTEHIIHTLEQLGFEWDEDIYYQSQHIRDYQQALQHLQQQQFTYACTCSRKQIKTHSSSGMYPGTCRNKQQATSEQDHAIRVKVPSPGNIDFKDLIQGHYSQELRQTVGDFIIYRRDRVFSYHLAIVVDEYLTDISHVIRGHDLIDSTPRQIYLQQRLNYPPPVYAHIPLAVTADNLKLSKLSHARKIDTNLATLIQAARFLGQKIDSDDNYQNKQDFWQHLFEVWQLKQVPKMEKIEIMY